MMRVERLVGEARSLRMVRARRAQAGAAPRDEAEWLAENAVAARLLADLTEGEIAPKPDGPDGERRKTALNVLDMAPLVPFIGAAVAALDKLVVEMKPQAAILADLYPRVCATLSAKIDPTLDDAVAPDRARRQACLDVAVLAVEQAMLEAVRRVMRANDRARITSPYRNLDVRIKDGCLQRTEHLAKDAERKRKARAKKREAADKKAGRAPRPARSPAAPFAGLALSQNDKVTT